MSNLGESSIQPGKPFNRKDLDELAKSKGVAVRNISDLIDEIVEALLRQSIEREDRPELAAKARKVYKEFTGAEYLDGRKKVVPKGIYGTPGMGKTTAFKEGCKKFSELMGLTYIQNPPSDFGVNKEVARQIDDLEAMKRRAIEEGRMEKTSDGRLGVVEINDRLQELRKKELLPLDNFFIMASLELAGESSGVTIGGIPARDQFAGESPHMTKLFNRRLMLSKRAGAGMILLDDLFNANPSVMNQCLPLIEERRFSDADYTGVYVAMTGNLGAIDGTNTQNSGTALLGRIEGCIGYDPLEDFCLRAERSYRDEIGDAGFTAWLKRMPEHYTRMPDRNDLGGFNAPRSHDHAINIMCHEINTKGGMRRGAPWVSEIVDRLSGVIGRESALIYQGFMQSYLQNAVPLAYAAVVQDKFDEAAVKQQLGNGLKNEEKEFAYQFGVALADYAVLRVINDEGKLKNGVKAFASALLQIEDQSVITAAVSRFRQRLPNQVESLSRLPNDAEKSMTRGRLLTSEAKADITRIFAENPHIQSDDQMHDIISALVGTAEHKQTAKRQRTAKASP